MISTQDIIGIIDSFILNNLLTDEDYKILNTHIEGMISMYGYKGYVEANEVLNEVLLYMKSSKTKYNTSYKTFQKKRYVNYIILKSIQKILKVTQNFVDASESKIFPYLKDKEVNLKSVADRLGEEEGRKDDSSDNIIMVQLIMDNLRVLSKLEYDIFVDIFLLSLTQEQCADSKKLTQQRISQIIKTIKNKITSSILQDK